MVPGPPSCSGGPFSETVLGGGGSFPCLARAWRFSGPPGLALTSGACWSVGAVGGCQRRGCWMAALGLPGVCRVASAFTSVRGHCCASFRPLNLSWGPGAFLELSSGPSTGRAWAVFARGADDRPLAAVRGLLPAGVDAVF